MALKRLMPEASSKIAAAVFGGRLQHDIDFALLDDAVGLGGDAGAGEQVANVAEAAGLAIDQIFAFAAAIDAASDVDFGRVERNAAVGVVERERGFGGVRARCGWTSRRR